MIIDSHTHLGRPGGALESRAVDLVKSMDAAGIDKSMVFAGRLNSITTEQVIAEIKPFKDRLHAIGSVSMGNEDEFVVDRIHHLLGTGQIHGLKFYTGYEHFYPDAQWLRPVLESLVKYDRPAIFHSGDTFSKVGDAKLKYAMPIHIDDLAVDMPELKIIIAHFGYPWQREAGEVVYKNKNVYADCSGGTYGKFSQHDAEAFIDVWDEFVRVAGSENKILFGSDWPIADQASYVDAVNGLTTSMDVIGLNNPVKLFGL